LFIDTAFADNKNKDKIKPGNNFGFTNKIENGKLVTLNVQLEGRDGNPTKCDTSTAEIKVHKIWGINPGKGHLLVKATTPSVVNTDCTVEYKDGMYVVTEQGAAIEVAIDGDKVVRVIEAGDEARNLSDRALLIFQSGAIATLDVNSEGNAVVSTLTNSGLPIKFQHDYTLAFDGTYLVGLSAERRDVVLVFNTIDTSFKFITTSMSDPGSSAVESSGYYSSIFLTHTGKFVWHEMNAYSRELNITAGTYTPWAPIQPSIVNTQWNTPMQVAVQPGGQYGFKGRSGQWILSDRCQAWNYETKEWRVPTHPTLHSYPTNNVPWQYVGAGGGMSYVNMANGFVHCVNQTGNIFTRLKLDDLSITRFDTDQLQFFFSAGKKYEIFQDKAMLWGAVSTSNGDIKVMELNFDTGTVKDHGVISVGTRKVVELVPVGR
jgi:hypothetical protein